MAKIVPPLVFRKQAEYDGKYDAVSECELRPHETFKLLRAHALQQLYIICHANNGSLWKTKRRRGYHYFHVRDVHSHQLLAHVRRLSLRRSVKFHTMSFPFPPMLSSVVSRPCLDAAQKHRQTCYVSCRNQPVNLARVA